MPARALLLTALLAACPLMGCRNGDHRNNASMGAVNGHCPVCGASTNTSGAVSEKYNGERVSFDSAACRDRWDNMSSSDKNARLTNVR